MHLAKDKTKFILIRALIKTYQNSKATKVCFSANGFPFSNFRLLFYKFSIINNISISHCNEIFGLPQATQNNISFLCNTCGIFIQACTDSEYDFQRGCNLSGSKRVELFSFDMTLFKIFKSEFHSFSVNTKLTPITNA